MLAEELRVGFHVSERENIFVTSVISDIRGNGYEGPIQVVGSREKGFRISRKKFFNYCYGLDVEEYRYWRVILDDIARKYDMSSGEIETVRRFLPEKAPVSVRRMLRSRRGLGADLDLAIECEIGKIEATYEDLPSPRGSGLVVEVYEPGDFSYLEICSF